MVDIVIYPVSGKHQHKDRYSKLCPLDVYYPLDTLEPWIYPGKHPSCIGVESASAIV